MDNEQAITIEQPARRRFHLNGRIVTMVIAGAILALVIAIFIAGPLIPDSAVGADFTQKNLPPSWSHLFGTDWLGRDMFLRTIKGLALSITVGVVASLASSIIAIIIGIVAATGSRWLDALINWVIDLVMGVPHLILLILISFVCGKGFWGLMIGLICTHWCSLARLIRAEVLQIRTQQYIAVSRRLGKSSPWILLHHILPHMIPQFIIGVVLMFPHAILHESSLSFLGFGLPPEQPAIGIILAESMLHLTAGHWWLAVLPGLSLVLIVVLFEMMGESFRKLLDPMSAHE